MKRIIMRTYGIGYGFGDTLTGDCDCAVLEVTEEGVARLRRLGTLFRQMKEQESCLAEIVEWGMPLDVYSYDVIDQLFYLKDNSADDPLLALFENQGWCELPPEVDLSPWEDKMQRTEGDRLHILGCDRDVITHEPQGDDLKVIVVKTFVPEFHWSFRPKHADYTVETPQLELSDLDEVLNPKEASRA